MKCFVCGKHGHIKTGCPVVKEAQNTRKAPEVIPAQVSGVVANNDLGMSSIESAAAESNVEMSTSVEEREQPRQGGSVEITAADAKASDARQSGVDGPVETVEELEQPAEQDRPKVTDVLDEVQASNSNMSQNDLVNSQVADSDLDSECSDLITDELVEPNSQESTVGRLTKPRYYSVEQLDDFLNATKKSEKTKD
ncbi:hypothetical protein QQF64_012039 [Cirrhinus molitorella]|uniref:CCHC-type domain-containing protein n=1 Tax=Cirrhinus molitorella TaxID=172907 RepID=A0ABR3LXI6_9TELE